MECGHGGLCMRCAKKCRAKRPPVCPMCRQRITLVVRVKPGEVAVDAEEGQAHLVEVKSP